MTQGDKIRNMKDDELVEFIYNKPAQTISNDFCWNICPHIDKDCPVELEKYGDCLYSNKKTILLYLESEVEE